jgi:hypothetical protein
MFWVRIIALMLIGPLIFTAHRWTQENASLPPEHVTTFTSNVDHVSPSHLCLNQDGHLTRGELLMLTAPFVASLPLRSPGNDATPLCVVPTSRHGY